jgi:alkane 1-monooxygenase
VQDSNAVGSTGPATGQVPWTDRKRHLWLFGLLVPLFPFLGGGLATLTGWSIFWYLGPLEILIIIPIIDLLAGLDRSNPPDGLIKALEADKYYRWITFLYLPLQYAALVWACWLWAGDTLSVFEKVGLALTVGTVAGIGINTAHELGHKKEKHERWLAKIALAQSFYGHFYIEHNRGHHVRVATPEDPASARVGESVYVFLPRTIIGSLRSAWRLEQPRFRRRNQSHWSIRNDVLNAWLMSVVLWSGLLIGFGVGILPYLLLQAAVGIVLLEIVNYLEHYGLARQREDSGRWERVRPAHSWNSNNIATNVLLYHLQRHSDHHANPTRRYQALRDDEQAPALPTGYAGMVVLALIPRLWRSVMDPRVLRHYGGDITRANIQPSRRARILAAHAAPAGGVHPGSAG